MSTATDIVSHYARGSLAATIESALAKTGIDRAGVTVDDLAPVDEFHIGGRGATVHLLSHLDLTEGRRVPASAASRRCSRPAGSFPWR